MTERELLAMRPGMLRSARKWGLGEDDAEDAVIVTLANVWNSREVVTGAAKAYVRRALRNTVLNMLNAKARQPRLECECNGHELVHAAQVADISPEQELLAKVMAAAERSELLEAVRTLPVDQRNAVVAIAFEGLTPVEYSEAAGIPHGTVKSRLHRAKQALMHLLSPPPAFAA